MYLKIGSFKQFLIQSRKTSGVSRASLRPIFMSVDITRRYYEFNVYLYELYSKIAV